MLWVYWVFDWVVRYGKGDNLMILVFWGSQIRSKSERVAEGEPQVIAAEIATVNPVEFQTFCVFQHSDSRPIVLGLTRFGYAQHEVEPCQQLVDISTSDRNETHSIVGNRLRSSEYWLL